MKRLSSCSGRKISLQPWRCFSTLKPDIDAFMQDAGWLCRLTARAHLGPVVAGPFGSRQSKRFDVIGVTVNAAARLPSTGVTISRSVYDGLPGDLKARFREGKIDGAFVLRG